MNNTALIYVIGSGPAGVSAAKGLLERGFEVTMLDAGIDKDYDNSLSVKKTSDSFTKLAYGSDFPYAYVKEYFPIYSDKKIECSPSFARGGLSNVWGSYIETYVNTDLASWPFTLERLWPFYNKVFDFLPRANYRKSSELTTSNYYLLSRQAESLLNKFTINRKKLEKNSITFGTPVLGVNFRSETDLCDYCALCQRGCPKHLIYCTESTLNEMKQNPRFSYINNIVVKNIDELDDEVVLKAETITDKTLIVFRGKNVFLGCGPIISTALVISALQQDGVSVPFLDSSHFFIPCLMYHRLKKVDREKLYTLCQLFLKINSRQLSTQPINLQVYTYMDHYTEKLKSIFKKLYPLARFFLSPVLDRLIVIQGHFHSDDSHQFLMMLKDNTIQLTAKENQKTYTNFKKLIRHLKKNSVWLGFYPIKFLSRLSKITKSFHYGGSMPMAKLRQSDFSTDLNGVPKGLNRIHIVDASIFPSIPAGSITPTIMANAYRIAAESTIYE